MNDTTVNGRVAPGQAGEPGVRDRRSGTPESRPQLEELRFGRVGDGAGRVPPAPLPGPAPPARRARRSFMNNPAYRGGSTMSAAFVPDTLTVRRHGAGPIWSSAK